MGPTCAVCRQPLTKGQKMSIAGTEAVHRVCLSQLSGSALSIARQEAIRQKGIADQARIEASRASSEASQVRGELQRLRAERDHLIAETTMLRQLTAERENAGAARARREMQQQVDRLTRERDNLRRELALAQVLSGTQTGEGADGGAAKDERDPTSIRFSLLEPE